MGSTPSEADRIREREHAVWSSVADGWRAYDTLITEMFRPVTEAMVRLAELRPGMRVLDLASGTGEPSLAMAEKVGDSGAVLGVDLAEPMLAIAREKARHRRLANVDYRVADIESADLPAEGFDVATMRWGIMFVPDPVAAMRAVHRALRPGGRLVLATWGAPAENPMLRLPIDVLRRHTDVPKPPRGAPGVFAFDDPGRIAATLASAGFTAVETWAVPLRFAHFPTGQDYWQFIRAIGGPINRFYEPLPAELRARVDAEVVAEASRFDGPAGLDFPGSAWLGRGTK
jgi:ubiquinone/menaquinone biosynthesis C-methylase UbiE